MTRKTTRDAALSRLFGGEEKPNANTPSRNRSTDDVSPEPSPSAPAIGDVGEAREVRLTSSMPRADTPKGRTRAAGAEKQADEKNANEIKSGYIGFGRYAREGGILERITPYVRPDQAEALRVAVARKRDARGRDISGIIQSLLDEAGYSGPGGGGEK